MDKFETYIKTELGLSAETFSAYLRDVKELIDFAEEQKLTAQLIDKFIYHLRQRGLMSTTIRRKCMAVRCWCRHLISIGHLDSNILDMINSVRINRKIPNALDAKDVDALVAAVESRVPVCRAINVRRDVSIILIMYHSGLRVSELCSLNLVDINFSNRIIKVVGKGGRERMVPTTHECINSIQEYIDLYRQSDTNAVFVQNNGMRITRRAVSDMLLSLSFRSGVKRTTAHMLRRSFATSLMNKGVDLEFVKTLLGHERLSTTQAYLAISSDRLTEVHKRCHPFGEKHEVG